VLRAVISYDRRDACEVNVAVGALIEADGPVSYAAFMRTLVREVDVTWTHDLAVAALE